VLFESIQEGFTVGLLGGRSRHHYEVHAAQLRLTLTETLPRQALDAVTVNCSADAFLGDCQPEPRTSMAGGASQHGQVGVCRLLCVIKNMLKIGGGAQPMRTGKAEARRSQALTADSKPLAAFGAAGIDDLATAGGFHSGTKAVGADALNLARLIRSFHRGFALGY